MTLESLHKDWVSLDLDKIEQTVLKELEPEILDLNKQQLLKGEGADGDSLPEYSSLPYANFKSSIGSKSGTHYDTKVTGNFHDGFYLKKERDGMYVDSKDEKTDYLLSLTKGNIFGLQDKNMDTLSKEAITPTIREIEKHLKL